MQYCYIGIDGGGTKTVGVAIDEHGTVLARATDTAINYCSVGMDKAIDALSRIVNALTDAAGRPALSLAIGSSALDERMRDKLYEEFVLRMKADRTLGAIPHHAVHSDAYMALLALCGEERGGVLISGTGMMGLAAMDGALHTVGGWGDVFLDRGSGYYIGQAGLCAALDYADSLDDAGEALFLAMCEFYSLSSAAELIEKVYSPGFDKSQIAAFCSCVCALAEREDLRSLEILNFAADELCRYACSLGAFLGREPFRLGFYGSVLTKNEYILSRVKQMLQTVLPQAEIVIPDTSAEDAAAHYAYRRTLQ